MNAACILCKLSKRQLHMSENDGGQGRLDLISWDIDDDGLTSSVVPCVHTWMNTCMCGVVDVWHCCLACLQLMHCLAEPLPAVALFPQWLHTWGANGGCPHGCHPRRHCFHTKLSFVLPVPVCCMYIVARQMNGLPDIYCHLGKSGFVKQGPPPIH